MMWIKSILLFSWSRNAPIHSLGVSRVLLVSSRDSHAATRDVFISLIHLCFFLSMCLLIDLIFNYTSMDHLFMVNGKHTFMRCTFTGKLWEGGGDFRGMKWFSRGYKGGSFVINQEWSLSRSHHSCISVVDFLLLIESICFFRCRRMYYQYPQLWRQCWLQQYRRLF